MKQTKLGSFIESLTNTLIGYFVALASQMIIFPLLGKQFTLTENLLVGLWFVGVSIVRGYYVRRWYESRGRAFLFYIEGRVRAFIGWFKLKGGMYVRSGRFIGLYGGVLGAIRNFLRCTSSSSSR